MALSGRASFEAKGNFSLSSVTMLMPPVLTLVWLLVLAATKTLTPVSGSIACVVTGLPFVFYLVYRVYRDIRPSLCGFRRQATLLLAYGIRAYGSDLCGTLSLYVDQALVVALLSPESLGIYGVTLGLSRVLNVFHIAVITVLFPRSVAQSAGRILELTGRAARISTALSLTFGVAICICGQQVLRLVYGPQYASAGGLLDIMIAEVTLSGMALVLSQAYMALGRPGTVTIFQTSGLLLTVPLVILFVPRLGLTGAGLALLCSTLIRLILVCGGFRVLMGLTCPSVLPSINEIRFIVSEAMSLMTAPRRPAAVTIQSELESGG
jgi:O-antigen/teichoic acid export membrane protein